MTSEAAPYGVLDGDQKNGDQKNGDQEVALPEIISAFSFALDMTEDGRRGHAARCTLLGMRIGRALELSTDKLAALYYALQLKDVGCSSNSARMAQVIGGDDRKVKAGAKLTDWTGFYRTDRRTLKTLWSTVLPRSSRRRRMLRTIRLGILQKRNNAEMIGLRCERGAAIVRQLGMGELTAEAVLYLDEHWNGAGYPARLCGTAIPLLARICSVAQSLEVFAWADGPEAAMELLRKRSGRWFDPALVKRVEVLHRGGNLWTCCEWECPVEVTRQAVLAECPQKYQVLGSDRIDAICEAFAHVVDAKSPSTYRHSLRVTETAVALAQEIRLTPERVRLIRRAALLHDLGKLSISNLILDKPGALTPGEKAVMSEHSRLTRAILERVLSFRDLARIAGEHHERLDGSGYPDGLTAAHLCIESRLLAVADCFATLAEYRPYREAYPVPKVLTTLKALTPHQLDPYLFQAMEAVVARWDGALPEVFHTQESEAHVTT